MSKPSSNPSKGKTGANAVLFVVIMVAALVALNLIGTKYFGRIDTTQDKIFTLSKGSKDLVKNLPDRLNVKLFVSQDLNPQFKQLAQFVRDLLGEYATYSGGQLNLEVIKIGEGETKKEEEASKYKVQKSNRGVVSANKFEIGSTYLGIGLDYHGNIESIPIVDKDQGLEFEISGLIKQMTVKKKKVAFASSEGELPLAHAGIQYLGEQLKASGFETTSLELKANIPADVDALLIVGPKQPMSERGKYVVDQFLMKGKSVAFFVDGQTMSTPKGMMMPGMDMPQISQSNDTGLDDLLGAYGVKVRQDLILDKQNYIGPVTVGQQVLGINHPVFMAAGPLPQGHPINEHIQIVILPYASSLELVGDAKNGTGPKWTTLIQSSKESWRPQGPFVMSPTQRPRDMTVGTDRGPFPIGVVGEGLFKSAFAGKQIVKEDGTKVDGTISQPGVEAMLVEAKTPARLVVVGDSDFISDQYISLTSRGLQYYVENLKFVLNVIDWLAQDEALAQVRNKGMQNRRIEDIGESKVTAIKAANIVGLPLLLLIIGLVRWRLRQSARSSAKL